MTDFYYGRYLVIQHFEHVCVCSVCSDQANPQSQREVQGVVLHHRWRNILAAPALCSELGVFQARPICVSNINPNESMRLARRDPWRNS